MKKLLLIILSVFIVLLSSCNPDSNTSIIFDKLHANPSSNYRIFSYVGDYSDGENEYLVLGTNLGIILYDYDSTSNVKYSVIISPIARPLMLVNGAEGIYVLYYEQNTDKDAILKANLIFD